jgi:tripartite-type tricarboxylate transporter receptor subunit TctC
MVEALAAGSCPGVAGKKMRWVVPFSPGGGYDAFSRLIEPFYEKRIGAEIVVENVTGAGGMVGARTVMEAKPDGLTVGLINAPGLLIAGLGDKGKAPSPLTDFTILGRVSSYRHIWATSSSSPFQTVEDLLAEAGRRPIIAAVTETGGTAFANSAITSHLLGIDVEYVAGYTGSRQLSMAVIRGDVDIGSFGFESSLKLIEAGEIRPLLQASLSPIAHHPALKSVPLLGGKDGLAVNRARELGRDPAQFEAIAEALDGIFSGGRLIVAPPGLEEGLFHCLADGLYRTMTDPEFQKAAAGINRTLDVADAVEARAGLESTTRHLDKFVTIIREAIKKVRGG